MVDLTAYAPLIVAVFAVAGVASAAAIAALAGLVTSRPRAVTGARSIAGALTGPADASSRRAA
jgi:hypothetical protein